MIVGATSSSSLWMWLKFLNIVTVVKDRTKSAHARDTKRKMRKLQIANLAHELATHRERVKERNTEWIINVSVCRCRRTSDGETPFLFNLICLYQHTAITGHTGRTVQTISLSSVGQNQVQQNYIWNVPHMFARELCISMHIRKYVHLL